MTSEANLKNNNLRAKAFLIHLGITAGILLVILAMVVYLWYPREFVYIGGLSGVKLLALVTLVVGPVLTLVLFDTKKRIELIKLDLVLIALAQAGCIAYGTWLIYQERPLVQVLADDGVYVHSAGEFTDYHMKLSDLKLEDSTPHHIILNLPPDMSQLEDLKLIHQLINKKPFSLSEELMVSNGHIDAGIANINDRIAYIQSNLNDEELRHIAGLESIAGCSWLPLYSYHGGGAVCYNPAEGIVEVAIE